MRGESGEPRDLMYDKYRIAKKWVEDVQNHANWAKETFERVILIPCVILIEACSVVRLSTLV